MAPTLQAHFHAIDPAELARIRAASVDDFGNPVVPVVDEHGGSPLRCCLTDASPGDRIALIAFRPFDQPGPYAEVGPVFVHADGCAGYGTPDRYPDGFRDRRQLLRAYDHQGRITEGIQSRNGDQSEALLEWLLSRHDVAFVHSRNVEWGCYMFSVARP